MTKSEEISYKDFLKIPNLISSSRVIAACLILIFTFLNFKIYLIKWFFIGGVISDKLDGFLARKLNQKTKLGLILEHLADTFLVLFTILFIFYHLDFPELVFYSYLGILCTGFLGCLIVYFSKGQLFADKLVVSEFAIIFIYATGIFYLFNLPYKLELSYFTLFLGFLSLFNYLFKLYQFGRKKKKSMG